MATNFEIVDLPGTGLFFSAGSLPAFHNGAGVTYDIRFRVEGSNVWHTHMTNVDASRPFSFMLPQPGNIRYTAVGFFFGDVPANFGLGDSIVLTFIAGSSAPNNTLVNRFYVSYSNRQREGGGETTLIPPPPRPPGNLRPDGDGYIDLDDNNVPQGSWEWRDGNSWVFIPNQNIPLGQLPQTGLPASFWLLAGINVMAVGALSTLIINKYKTKRIKK